MGNRTIVLLIMFISYLNAAGPDISDFHSYGAYDEGKRVKGNCFYPVWSQNGDRLGIDFSSEDLLSVGICELESDRISVLNLSSGGDRSTPGLGGQAIKKENTWNMVFSDTDPEIIYAISSRERYRHLYEISLVRDASFYKVGGMSNICREINELGKGHIFNPVIYTVLKKKRFGDPEKNSSILFSFSSGGSENTIARLEMNSLTNQMEFRKISQGDAGNDFLVVPRLNADGMSEYLVIGSEQGSRISYSKEFEGFRVLLNEAERVYKNVHWVSGRNAFAYLRSEESVVESSTGEVNLLYSLQLYDLNTGKSEKLYYPVFIENKKDRQSSLTVSPDGKTAIVINAEAGKKQNLVAVSLDGSGSYEIVSPYMHHFDVAYSPDGQRIAFTAKGSFESDELNYYKLYTATINK